MIDSCLQQVMGEVFADDLAAPQSAVAILADFCFFAGVPNENLVSVPLSEGRADFVIMVPQNPAWGEVIAGQKGVTVTPVTRYAIKKEPGIFDRDLLNAAVASLADGYCLEMMDERNFNLCRNSRWSRDLVSQYTDFAMYRELGVGAVVTKDGEVVAGASSYTRYREGIEIEIDTRMDCRRQGLALACGARLILECLDLGMYPSWDAQNQESVALAEKLGYHFSHEYPAFEVCKEES